MQNFNKDSLVEFGVAIFITISGVLISIIIFFTKKFFGDVRDKQTENRAEFKEIEKENKEIRKELKGISERIVRLEIYIEKGGVKNEEDG